VGHRASRGELKARGLTGREIFIDEWNTSYVMDAGPGADSDTNRTAAGVAARIYNALEHPEITKIFYFAPLEGYIPIATQQTVKEEK